MYTYIYAYIYVYVYIYIYIHTFTHTYVYVYIHEDMYVLYTDTHAQMNPYTCLNHAPSDTHIHPHLFRPYIYLMLSIYVRVNIS